MDAEQLKEAEAMIKSMLIEHVPHAKAIKMEVLKIEPAKAWLTIPYQEKLIGNPDYRGYSWGCHHIPARQCERHRHANGPA